MLLICLVFINSAVYSAEVTPLPKYVAKLREVIGTRARPIQAKIRKYLLKLAEHGEDINARDDQGRTLAHAITQAEIDGWGLGVFKTESFIREGLLFDVCDDAGKTPFAMLSDRIAANISPHGSDDEGATSGDSMEVYVGGSRRNGTYQKLWMVLYFCKKQVHKEQERARLGIGPQKSGLSNTDSSYSEYSFEES